VQNLSTPLRCFQLNSVDESVRKELCVKAIRRGLDNRHSRFAARTRPYPTHCHSAKSFCSRFNNLTTESQTIAIASTLPCGRLAASMCFGSAV
jgi:hypothetical protein